MPGLREKPRCRTCGRDRDETRLEKCIVCHEAYCRVCAVRRHGKLFCTRDCAEVFFFGGEDQEAW